MRLRKNNHDERFLISRLGMRSGRPRTTWAARELPSTRLIQTARGESIVAIFPPAVRPVEPSPAARAIRGHSSRADAGFMPKSTQASSARLIRLLCMRRCAMQQPYGGKHDLRRKTCLAPQAPQCQTTHTRPCLPDESTGRQFLGNGRHPYSSRGITSHTSMPRSGKHRGAVCRRASPVCWGVVSAWIVRRNHVRVLVEALYKYEVPYTVVDHLLMITNKT